MESSDHRVLAAALSSLASGRSGWLVTIAATFGASPRPLGSLMWLEDSGAVWGSVSGGCIEDDLLDKLAGGELVDKPVQLLEYGVSPEENERFGLPCGGRMRLLFEQLTLDRRGELQRVLTALDRRQAIRRRVDLTAPGWQLEEIERCQTLQLGEQFFLQDFGPRYRLLLVGANELARCIAEIATALDYAVLVCDPREDRCAQWQVADTDLLQLMPDEAVMAYACDRHALVITLTHDPRIDDMALMQALAQQGEQQPFYIGALGSERTSAKRRVRLGQLGLTEQQIAGLHAPVGLAIGSKSAMEIAVAIMAELTALRRGRKPDPIAGNAGGA